MTIVYFTGFETGDASEINTLGAGSSIDGTTFHSGAYALKQAAANTFLGAAGGLALATFVFKFYFRFPTLPGASSAIIRFLTTSGTTLFDLALSAPSGFMRLQQGGNVGLSNTNGTKTHSSNTWYLIEVAYDANAGGIVKVWSDGRLEIDTTHTTDAGDLDRVRVNGLANPDEWFLDDIKIDDGLTPLGPSRVIARQGITGTPTYNAWTKSSGSDAFSLWSDTPFSAASNCSEATTVGDAQTMLVAPFSATQSGHGSEAIGPGDTINACKTAVIAKRSAGGSMDIRRRIGGADTDTARTVTTTDAYYDDGIWTTTPANLDTAEIGGQHTVAGTTTIEDAWLMVDYTPRVPVFMHDYRRRRAA